VTFKHRYEQICLNEGKEYFPGPWDDCELRWSDRDVTVILSWFDCDLTVIWLWSDRDRADLWSDRDLTVNWPWSDCDLTMIWPWSVIWLICDLTDLWSDRDLTMIWPWSDLVNQAKLFEPCAVSIQIMLTQSEVTQYKICTLSLEHARYKYKNNVRVAI